MSRIIIITFKLVIRGTDTEIQNYDDVLLQDKAGIFNWILEGYKAYVNGNRKIQSSSSTDQTLDFYIANSDFITYFLNGCTHQGSPEKDFVPKKALYEAYLKAARMRNAVTVGDQAFKGNLPRKCKFPLTDGRHEINGRQEHTFDGIVLKPEKYWFTEIDPSDFEKPNTPKKGGNGGKLSQDELPGLPPYTGVFAHGEGENETTKSHPDPAGSNVQNENTSDAVDTKPHEMKAYASVKVVLKALQDWGLDIVECSPVLYSESEWKAKIKGRLDQHSDSVQAFLQTSFAIVFKGTAGAPFMWIHFRVNPEVQE